MKKLVPYTILATLALSAPYALSQTAPKAEKKPAPAASAPMDMDKLYGDIQARFKKMQEQMEKIRQAKDPNERQKLWEEHWKTMHEGMGMMGMMMGRGPGGGGMMGGPMMGGPKGGPGMGPEAMQQRQEMMEKRMDMMQMMMEHMMEQQNPAMPAK